MEDLGFRYFMVGGGGVGFMGRIIRAVGNHRRLRFMVDYGFCDLRG